MQSDKDKYGSTFPPALSTRSINTIGFGFEMDPILREAVTASKIWFGFLQASAGIPIIFHTGL